MVSGGDPTFFFLMVMSDKDKYRWLGAMVEEMESLHKNKIWVLVELLKGKHVGFRWVYKRKPSISVKEREKFKA